MDFAKFLKLEFSKTIDVAWNDATRQKLAAYLSTRKFRFEKNSEAVLLERRGHVLWNLVSYDMTKLPAEITVTPSSGSGILLLLSVRTIFQQMTEWNRSFFELELSTCESLLLRNDLRESEWIVFQKGNLRAAILWTFTFGLAGQRLPKKGDRELKE